MLASLPEPAEIPFVSASLDKLESVLVDPLNRGPERLAQAGQRNRLWMERNGIFLANWSAYGCRPLSKARERAGAATKRMLRPTRIVPREHAPIAIAAEAPPPAPEPAPEKLVSHQPTLAVSVIVPHGGESRFKLLQATLAQLDRSTVAPEVILVEMDRVLRADALARQFAHRHVFIHSEEPFQLVRARNVGIPFARGEYVLWLDSDLLVPADFLGKALTEVSARGLDCLIPWTSVSYLSDDDSNAVIAGARRAEDCKPVNTFLSRRGVVGGAIMARKDFLTRYGGFNGEFRGWGGEDNAWLHKAQVLGRAGTTTRRDQHLYHVFHEDSGGYGSRALFAHPNYQRNIALLHRIRTIRNPTRFLQQFSPPCHFTAPWDGARRVACTAESARVGQVLKDLYGEAIVVTEPGSDADLVIDAATVSRDSLESALDAACRLSRVSAPIAPAPSFASSILEAEPAPAVPARVVKAHDDNIVTC
jgi:hypothetical protein